MAQTELMGSNITTFSTIFPIFSNVHVSTKWFMRQWSFPNIGWTGAIQSRLEHVPFTLPREVRGGRRLWYWTCRRFHQEGGGGGVNCRKAFFDISIITRQDLRPDLRPGLVSRLPGVHGIPLVQFCLHFIFITGIFVFVLLGNSENPDPCPLPTYLLQWCLSLLFRLALSFFILWYICVICSS